MTSKEYIQVRMNNLPSIAAKHPDVLSGKKTEDEVLAEFLDTFEYHFSLLNMERSRDAKITLEEFIEYYTNISMR